jgi:NTE family protein
VYGAEQVGMMKALVEAGHTPDLISAVSVGALNGVALAQWPSMEGVDRLEQTWRGIDSRWLFPGNQFARAMAVIRKHPAICDNSGVKRLIDADVHVEMFEDLRIPFFVTTADLLSGARRVFHTGLLREVLLATTAIPGVFPPVDIDGELMVDGGIVSNIPTAPAVTARPERTFILDVSRPLSNKVPQTPLGMMLQAFSITRNLQTQRDLEAASVLAGAVVIPRPDNDPAVAFDDTSKTRELIRAGYERTRRFLADEYREVA